MTTITPFSNIHLKNLNYSLISQVDSLEKLQRETYRLFFNTRKRSVLRITRKRLSPAHGARERQSELEMKEKGEKKIYCSNFFLN